MLLWLHPSSIKSARTKWLIWWERALALLTRRGSTPPHRTSVSTDLNHRWNNSAQNSPTIPLCFSMRCTSRFINSISHLLQNAKHWCFRLNSMRSGDLTCWFQLSKAFFSNSHQCFWIKAICMLALAFRCRHLDFLIWICFTKIWILVQSR